MCYVLQIMTRILMVQYELIPYSFFLKKKMNKLNIDCLVLIFDEMEKKSLYSCLLVNKEWCNIVVPILWKKFSWDLKFPYVEVNSKKLFNTIFSCLPPSSKQLLSDNGVKLPSAVLSGAPLFDYIGFCEFPRNYII